MSGRPKKRSSRRSQTNTLDTDAESDREEAGPVPKKTRKSKSGQSTAVARQAKRPAYVDHEDELVDEQTDAQLAAQLGASELAAAMTLESAVKDASVVRRSNEVEQETTPVGREKTKNMQVVLAAAPSWVKTLFAEFNSLKEDLKEMKGEMHAATVGRKKARSSRDSDSGSSSSSGSEVSLSEQLNARNVLGNYVKARYTVNKVRELDLVFVYLYGLATVATVYSLV
jgi:hypothetical protein